MVRGCWGLVLWSAALLASSVVSGPGELSSGPPPGALLPRAFEALTLNGKVGKGRYHCLVCEFGLEPTVLVFAREHSEGHDKALDELLVQLDQLLGRAPYERLRAAVVFLSPAARRLGVPPPGKGPAASQKASGAEGGPQPAEEKTPPEKLPHEKLLQEGEQLVREAREGRELLARLQPLAEQLKQVVVAVYPEEGPPGYQLAPQAEVTVLLYVKQQVTARFAFVAGGLTDKARAQVLEKVRALAAPAAPQEQRENQVGNPPRGPLPVVPLRAGQQVRRLPAFARKTGVARGRPLGA
jgi:hypothetical protein